MFSKSKVECEKIEAICTKCKKGVYRQTGNVDKEANPIVFEHKCSECKAIADFSMVYPVLKYRDKKFMLADSVRFLSSSPKPDV